MLNQRLFKFLDTFSYVLLLLNVFFVPLVVDKNLLDYFVIPKQYLFMGMVLLNVLLFAIKVVLSKRLVYRESILDIPVLIGLGLVLVASIFSVNIYDSFFGRSEYFVLNFIFLLTLIVFYFLITNHLYKASLWSGLRDALLVVGGVTTALFSLKILFHYDLLSSVFGISVWNLTDKINATFGLWSVVIFMIAAGQLIKKDISVGRALFNFFITILSLVVVVILGFPLIWWMLLFSLVLLLLLGVSLIKDARMSWLTTLFTLLVLTIILIAFGAPKPLRVVVPTEVSLGNTPSWNVVKGTMTGGIKNFLIGSGSGTFNVDFSQNRPTDFNYDPSAWSLRFGQPYSTLQALVAENGALFSLLFIVIILYVVGHIFQVWYHGRRRGLLDGLHAGFNYRENDIHLEVFLVAISWVVLTVGLCFVFFGSVLWWLWWLLLGLLISGLSLLHRDVIKTREWMVEDTPQYSLSFSFILIVLIASVVMVGVWGVRLYSGELLYAQALQSKDYKVAEEKLSIAIAQRPNTDTYHSALAQVYMMEATELAKQSKPDVNSVSVLISKAVNEAKRATELSPATVMIWENLAIMYENAAVVVPEARDWAIKSWKQAQKLEPTNAVLSWHLGNNYSVAGKWDEAIKSYEEAISLKKDYVGAYSGLANSYVQTNQLDKAVESYKTIIGQAPGNSEMLFGFGLTLYNRNKTGDRNDAEKLWLEAVRLSPNYSNALYSLGLLYDLRGNRSLALQYYFKVRELNPDNNEVANKIKALTDK